VAGEFVRNTEFFGDETVAVDRPQQIETLPAEFLKQAPKFPDD
jgi:hypothetical protein